MKDKKIENGKYLGMVVDGELHTLTHSLEMEHLGLSVDLMRKSRVASKSKLTGWQTMLVNRYALSSILHAFCALESTINFLGYEMFFQADSKIFIGCDERTPLLQKYIKSWDNKPASDKLTIVLNQYGCDEIPAKLENELRELSLLRNWITHGFSYTTTLLLEPKDSRYGETEYTVVDSEDSIDWEKKFPNTKFKPLRLLDYKDAKTALGIVLKVFKIISECFDKPFSLVTCEVSPEFKILFKDSFDISAILEAEVGS
jgi:hypothetical protein